MADSVAAARALLFDRAFMRKLERLELIVRRPLAGAVRGEHASPHQGRSLEFDDYRRYQPGDDLRYVDWNIYSRLDQLFLKLFSAEEDLTLHLLLDASASMGIGQPSKFDYARRLGAALAYVGVNRMDRVHVYTFDSALKGLGQPLRSRAQMRVLLDELAQSVAVGPTRFQAVCEQFAKAARRPGVVVVIADLLASGDVSAALRALTLRRHDVVVLQLLSEDDIDPPLDGALRLQDAESGESFAATIDAGLRAHYQQRLGELLASIEAACRRAGIEYLRASTAVPFEDVVLRYLRQGRLFG